MQYLDFDLTASATASQIIDIEGNYIKYVEEYTSTGNRVVVQSDNGGKVILKPGRGVRLSRTSKRWTILQYGTGAAAISGSLVIGGEDERIDDSLLVGAVAISGTVQRQGLTNSRLQQASVVVGVASSTVWAGSGGTVGVLFTASPKNTAPIELSMSTPAVLGNCSIVLAPGEGWLEEDFVRNAWYGISSVAGQSLLSSVGA